MYTYVNICIHMYTYVLPICCVYIYICIYTPYHTNIHQANDLHPGPEVFPAVRRVPGPAPHHAAADPSAGTLGRSALGHAGGTWENRVIIHVLIIYAYVYIYIYIHMCVCIYIHISLYNYVCI